MVEDELVLVTSYGEEVRRSGDSAGFAAGVPDGRHIQNRSNRQAVLLEISSRRPETDACDYPDNGSWSSLAGRFVRTATDRNDGFGHRQPACGRSSRWGASDWD
jgi:uncharacterized cupin superfamily protein